MGDDLAVVQAAKDPFGRRSEWEIGFQHLGNGQFTDVAGRMISKGDTRLVNCLARGCTQGDWDEVIAEVMLDAGSAEKVGRILDHYRDQPIHKSPFNHCFVKFHCQAPIFVARQLVKDEYLFWNEISGRYVQFEPDFFQPHTFRATAKAKDKNQRSAGPITGQRMVDLQGVFDDAHAYAYAKYKQALALGLCEEQARGLLPLDTMTQWIWSGSLGAWAKMCKLRLAPDAQYEARVVAQMIDADMQQLFPVAWTALMTNGQARYQGVK